MATVFISYRRDDSAFAAYAVYDRLAERLGEENIFIDAKDIPLGVDFREVLTDTLERCDVLLAFVGQHWLYDCARGERAGAMRLDDADDYVRMEIATCLKRGVPIVPVLCGEVARMPAENELPEELRKFVRMNGLELRPGRGIFLQIEELASNLQRMLLLKERAKEGAKEEKKESTEEAKEEPKESKAETEEEPKEEPKEEAAALIRYRKAYISYSSKDRAEVLKRMAFLKVANIEPILDVAPRFGAFYKDILAEQISQADVFFLFWSSHAAQSAEVRKEVEIALSRNIEIVPIILEMPPPPPPPYLSHLHFNDLSLYTAGRAEKPAGGET